MSHPLASIFAELLVGYVAGVLISYEYLETAWLPASVTRHEEMPSIEALSSSP